jgi:hypothetical protein
MTTRKVLIGSAAALVVIGMLASNEDKPSSTAASAPATTAASTVEAERKAAEAERKATEEAAELARCQQDKACLANKLTIPPYACRKEIESLAKYDFQWKDEWLELKFSHFRWSDWEKRILTHIGDKIEFKNGFGGWIRHTYECDVDVSKVDLRDRETTKLTRVLAVRATPGRIQ